MILLRKNTGFVFVFVLCLFSAFLVYGTMFVLRSMDEWRVAEHQRRSAQAFALAEAAGEIALDQLDEFVNVDLLTAISGMNPQTVGKKSGNAVLKKGGFSGVDFLIEMVNSAQQQFVLSDDGTQALYSQSSVAYGAGSYTYNIAVRENGNVVETATDMWEFPFSFHLEGQGGVSGTNKSVIMEGNFTVQVRKDNFAKYALFSDHHTMKNGGTVWFTDSTNFAGPIHTNGQFCFAGDPALAGLAGIFDGIVTQHENKALFYDNGHLTAMNADASSYDIPVFSAGFSRGVGEIVLASSVQKQDLYEHALGSQTPSSGNGIYIANNGSDLIGGIYVKGNAEIVMDVDTNDNAQYRIKQGGVTKIVTVDIPNDQTTVENLSTGTTEIYSGLPDGQDDLGTIIYVNGEITSLKGTVQRDTELTISCENDAIITDNIMYTEYTPATGTPGSASYIPPSAEGYTNLLGIVAWGGDIRIGTAAPDDLNVHGVMMARNGVFTVDYYNYGSPRGYVTLMGGVITQFYGAFGLFNASSGSQISGYGRNFNYDARMMKGKSPPYFPTMKTFIGFTDDLTDHIVFWEGDAS